MTDYVRAQILLEEKQKIRLDEIAKESGITFSEVVRNFLNAQLLARTYQDMQFAAERLYADYTGDQNLTDMTLLDGEDFINAQG